MIERQEVEIFLTLAEELHFGRTAKRLHLSPSSVSQTVGKLERRIGTPLFHRTSRQVRLSEIGAQLYQDLLPAWSQAQAAMARAIRAGQGGEHALDILFISIGGGHLLTTAADEFRRRSPHCQVRIREAQLADVMQRLRADTADAAFMPYPVTDPDIVVGPVLITEPRLLAVAATHRLAGQPDISLEELADEQLLRMPESMPESVRVDRNPAYTPAGRRIPQGAVSETFLELMMLAAAGKGVVIVSAHTALFHVRPDLAYVPIRDAGPLQWGLVWRADRDTALLQSFNEVCAQVAADDPLAQ
ncbi:LysR family transcriptional regulator [Nocardia sp. NPDC006044]|uniref:LysR family transcriptional regulator n=1 Tax=Nocardia sp. NPDC006044 TaxID=3364306 RepID=UPI0036910CD3